MRDIRYPSLTSLSGSIKSKTCDGILFELEEDIGLLMELLECLIPSTRDVVLIGLCLATVWLKLRNPMSKRIKKGFILVKVVAI